MGAGGTAPREDAVDDTDAAAGACARECGGQTKELEDRAAAVGATGVMEDSEPAEDGVLAGLRWNRSARDQAQLKHKIRDLPGLLKHGLHLRKKSVSNSIAPTVCLTDGRTDVSFRVSPRWTKLAFNIRLIFALAVRLYA